MKMFDVTVATISLVLVLLGLLHKKMKRSVINETLMAMLIGIALSPLLLNVLDLTKWGDKSTIMEVACRITIAMALMATAFRIPKNYLSHNMQVQGVMIFIIMPAMFLTSAAIIHFVIGLDWLISLLIGAVITPTDPVLAGTIVTGEKAKELLPQKIRDTISFEAGANDGLAFPFVMLCLLLYKNPSVAWKEWFFKTIMYETVGAIFLGAFVGFLLGLLLRYSISKKYSGKPAILAFSLSVALLVVTGFELVHVNSILAVFVVGYMLKEVLSSHEDIEEEEVQEMMARLFTIPIFLFFGLIIPWEKWLELGWNAVLLVVLVILLRRLPFLFVVKPLLKDFKTKDVAFVGWFGPIGVAALYYCFHAYKELKFEEIWTITSLVVFTSVVAHGVTAYPLLKKYSEKK